jgi:hypothetical protein
VQSISPLLAWFFTFILIALAGRAIARLALARSDGRLGLAERGLGPAERNRELGHAAMGFGMAVLLAPGLPRPPQAVSVSFFAALAALAAVEWARRLWAGGRGRATAACGPAEGGRLLDPHHAIVGLAMVVMLLQPGGSGVGTVGGGAAVAGASSGAGNAVGGGGAVGAASGMSGMAMGATPNAAILLLLAYVWIAALVLGHGMTRVYAAPQPGDGGAVALLSSPATVYACEIAMTVLTGLMLLN